MKAYIYRLDNDADQFRLSTEPPPTWAGIASDFCKEVELDSGIILMYKHLQDQWEGMQESLETVFDMRV